MLCCFNVVVLLEIAVVGKEILVLESRHHISADLRGKI